MKAEPQKEHRWLQKLVGEWTYEHECPGPDGKIVKHTGTEVVRPLGELWTLGEGTAPMGEDAGEMRTLMTLGYDPVKKRFVGIFIASVMSYLWTYEGELNEADNTLTLNAEGPDFAGEGKMTKYRDVIAFTDEDHRTLSSAALGPDGTWQQFMLAHYRRRK